MPFTFSHPAAVLPMLDGARGRGPLIASALVAGSMAPDVPYYAESFLPGAFAVGDLIHQWWAVPTADLAVAGALVALWHGLLRGPVVALLPGRWAAVAEAATAPAGGWTGPGAKGRPGWFAASAVIGAATHVFWDSFTHDGAAGVRAFPVLDHPVAGVPLHAALQYGTSLLGLGYIGLHLRRVARSGAEAQPLTEPVRPRVRRAVLGGLAVATVAGVVQRLARGERDFVGEFCFGGGAGLAAGLVVYAGASRLLARRRREPSRSHAGV
ncbi:DUF4184 family protein [Kitasatospora sp. McL0602]|uniref:DUF4184 family protein n=1 Tax=Kitasatospora sp. McL0602 TaxID=3439530 RepID=UPI003F88B5AA